MPDFPPEPTADPSSRRRPSTRSIRNVGRRTIVSTLAVLLMVVCLGAAALATGGDSSTVTRARLERSLPVVFSNLYADQADLLGHAGVTPFSLHATAMCDKHGPDVADVGPGGDWICLMGWTDPRVPMPAEGYGKFELNVHSNGCWTASGPSKLTGFLTLTDTAGRDVANPVFEFDGCFDPAGDDTATGTAYPSALTITSTSLTPAPDGTVAVQLSCGTGSDGCGGTMSVQAGSTELGTLPFTLREESTATLPVPAPLPQGADQVSVTLQAAHGVGPASATTIAVQR